MDDAVTGYAPYNVKIFVEGEASVLTKLYGMAKEWTKEALEIYGENLSKYNLHIMADMMNLEDDGKSPKMYDGFFKGMALEEEGWNDNPTEKREFLCIYQQDNDEPHLEIWRRCLLRYAPDCKLYYMAFPEDRKTGMEIAITDRKDLAGHFVVHFSEEDSLVFFKVMTEESFQRSTNQILAEMGQKEIATGCGFREFVNKLRSEYGISGSRIYYVEGDRFT